jgi:hypothetical protein
VCFEASQRVKKGREREKREERREMKIDIQIK